MSTINKPLPHRPFSLAGNLEKAPRPRRQHQPQMTSVSTIRPYVQASDKFTVPPVPKRVHLVTRSPSPPYHHAAASDALPSSTHKPSRSFSESHARSNPNSSTSDLVPPHLKPTHTASFWRRHWNRITGLCHQFDSQHKRVRRQECDWRSPALRRANTYAYTY